MDRTSFYGGPNGQSFEISRIFRTKVEMQSDLQLKWQSSIGVSEYVIISYGLPNYYDYYYTDTNGNKQYVDKKDVVTESNGTLSYTENGTKYVITEALAVQDRESMDNNEFGQGYGSTLWQKIYTENDIKQIDALTGIETFYTVGNYGLGYKLIASMAGGIPDIIFQNGTPLDPQDPPRVDIDKTSPYRPVITFRLPRGLKFYYGNLADLGAKQDATSSDPSVANYGVGDYYVHENTGCIYQIVAKDTTTVPNTTISFKYEACLQAPAPTFSVDKPTFVGAGEDGGAIVNPGTTTDYNIHFTIPSGSRIFAGIEVQGIGNNDVSGATVTPHPTLKNPLPGDLYLNTQTGTVYQLDTSGVWRFQNDGLKGPKGDPCRVVASYTLTVDPINPDPTNGVYTQYSKDNAVDYIKNNYNQPYTQYDLFGVTWVENGVKNSYWYFYTGQNDPITGNEIWGEVLLTGSGGIADIPYLKGDGVAYASGTNALSLGSNANTSNNYAIAIGYNSNSSNIGSIAIGGNTSVTGKGSVALGGNVTANGFQSVALGQYAKVDGTASVAIGSGANAIGNPSIALGNCANATGNSSIALGDGAVAKSANSIAIGASGYLDTQGNFPIYTKGITWANGDSAIALGPLAFANGGCAIAIGSIAKAQNLDSIAIGAGAIAEASSAIALGDSVIAKGQDSIALGSGKVFFHIGDETQEFQTSANGSYSMAIGWMSRANGGSSIVMGTGGYAEGNHSIVIGGTDGLELNGNPQTTGDYSIAIGCQARTKGNNAIAIGTGINYNNPVDNYGPLETSAYGEQSIAIGYLASTRSNTSTALGYYASAKGSASIALGPSADARGSYSAAFGCGANANGQEAVAVGTNANAIAWRSIALGAGTDVISNNSVAVGVFARAINESSIAIGHNSNASGPQSTALGLVAKAYGISSIALGHAARADTTGAIALGYQANAFGEYAVALGALTNANGNYSIALGYSATTSNENSIQLGNEELQSITARVSITTPSDERDKTDIVEIGNGATEFLKSLRAVTFVYNQRALYRPKDVELDQDGNPIDDIEGDYLTKEDHENLRKYGYCRYDKEAHARGDLKGTRRRVGFLAQETQKALEKVYGSPSYANLVNDNLFDFNEVPAGIESALAMNYEGFIPFLVKAFQEQQQKIEELESRLQQVETKVTMR